MARICVIRQWFFPLDPRVRREVQALLDAGHEVDVLCLQGEDEPRTERHGALTIRRLPLKKRSTSNRLSYIWQYAAFFAMALVACAVLHARRRYRLVQVHSLPDTLVFAALVPKLTGARVVLDLHEVMPEFFSTKFAVPMDHRLVRAVAVAEQASIRFADRVITCTEEMRDAFVGRGADPGRIDVVVNAADEEIFDPDRYPPSNGTGDGHDRFTLIVHGSIEERYGLDTTIQAVANVADEIPELRLRVYGKGSQLPELEQMVSRLGLEDRVWFSNGYVPIEELVQAIADADAGVVAMKRDAFRDLTQCNKMFDFMSMRKPALVSRTLSVENYFGDGCFVMFESADADDMARAIRELHADPDRGRTLAERATAAVEPYRWPRQREIYLSAVERTLRA